MSNKIFWFLMFSGHVLLASESIRFLTPLEMDFGEVPSGRVVEGEIQFIITGGENVEIRELQVSCGCTAVEAVKRNYEPGDTATVSFKVNTRGFHGKVQKSITIEFENSDISPQTVLIRIDCIDYLDCYPNYVTFTQIHANADTTIEREVILSNHYRETVTLKSLKLDLPDVNVTVSSHTIPAGGKVIMNLELKPALPFRKSARLIITTDKKEIDEVRFPVYVNILE